MRDGWKPANNLHKTYENSDETGTFTASEYAIRQAAAAFYDNSAADLIEETIKSMQPKIFGHTISLGGGRDSVNSLTDFVSTTPTIGVIGGIGRDRHKFWRNLSVSYHHSVKLSEAMSLMINRLSLIEGIGAKKLKRPDLILMGKGRLQYFQVRFAG